MISLDTGNTNAYITFTSTALDIFA